MDSPCWGGNVNFFRVPPLSVSRPLWRWLHEMCVCVCVSKGDSVNSYSYYYFQSIPKEVLLSLLWGRKTGKCEARGKSERGKSGVALPTITTNNNKNDTYAQSANQREVNQLRVIQSSIRICYSLDWCRSLHMRFINDFGSWYEKN